MRVRWVGSPVDARELWMSMVVSLSTACIVSMCLGMRWYAWIRASSSTLRELSSPVLILIFPLRLMFVCWWSMTRPNDDDALSVLAPMTDPSEALYIVCVSALSSSLWR